MPQKPWWPNLSALLLSFMSSLYIVGRCHIVGARRGSAYGVFMYVGVCPLCVLIYLRSCFSFVNIRVCVYIYIQIHMYLFVCVCVFPYECYIMCVCVYSHVISCVCAFCCFMSVCFVFSCVVCVCVFECVLSHLRVRGGLMVSRPKSWRSKTWQLRSKCSLRLPPRE